MSTSLRIHHQSIIKTSRGKARQDKAATNNIINSDRKQPYYDALLRVFETLTVAVAVIGTETNENANIRLLIYYNRIYGLWLI